jgi:hypothetical protein
MLRIFDFNDDDLGQFGWTPDAIAALIVDPELRERVTMLAIQILLCKRFVLGKDFSMTGEGKILLTPCAEATLLENVPGLEQILMHQILQVS